MFVQVLPEIPGAALSWGSTTNRSSYRPHNVQERESDRLTAMKENQVGGRTHPMLLFTQYQVCTLPGEAQGASSYPDMSQHSRPNDHW